MTICVRHLVSEEHELCIVLHRVLFVILWTLHYDTYLYSYRYQVEYVYRPTHILSATEYKKGLEYLYIDILPRVGYSYCQFSFSIQPPIRNNRGSFCLYAFIFVKLSCFIISRGLFIFTTNPFLLCQ